MLSLADLAIRVDSSDVSRGTQSLQGLTAAGAKAEGSTLSLNRSMAVLGLGVAAAGVAFARLKDASLEYAASMREISTLVNTATFDVNALSKAAIAQAGAFNSQPITQTKALYQIISAGASSAAQATDTLTAANKLAVGGVTTVAIAADGLTSVLNAYGDKVSGATAVSDAMFIAMKGGKTTIAELSASLGTIAPLAASTGVSFDELTAATAALTKGGISTNESITGLRAILAAVAKPSDEAAKLSAKLGLEFNSTALASKGLAGFLADLQTKTGGNTDALAKLFGGVEALVPVMALSGQAGKDFNVILDQMAGKTGATQEAFDKIASGAAFQLGRIFSTLQANAIGVAAGLAERLAPALKTVADLVQGLERPSIALDFALRAAALSAAALAAQGLVAITTTAATAIYQTIALTAAISGQTLAMAAASIAANALGVAVRFALGPIGLAITAVGLLAAAWTYLDQEERKAIAANEAVVASLGGAKGALDAYASAIDTAASASGAGRVKALELAEANRTLAASAVQAARAEREKALAILKTASADAERVKAASFTPVAGLGGGEFSLGPGLGIAAADADVARVRDKATAATKAYNDAVKALAADDKRYADILKGSVIPAAVNISTATRDATKAARERKETLDRSAPAEVEMAKVVDLNAVSAVNMSAKLRELNGDLKQVPVYIDPAITALEDFQRATDDVSYSIGDMFASLKRGDFGGFIENIQSAIEGISKLASLSKSAAVAQVGSVIANTIGGKAGTAIGGGLGIAASGLGLGAFAASSAGAATLATLGLGSGVVGSIAALAGPLGIAAGALYAAVKLFNVGGKPTNAGAGFDLTTGALSGNKRTQETEDAARSAGESIRAIEAALKEAGLGLTDAVRGLVIGTRDETQIYLASGKELRSAVGDAGAAVDTAMRALLDGATYVSDAQRKLVESAVAAGKGFDGISEVLTRFKAAQEISGGLADEILRLTDPQAYALKAVTDAIEVQRKAYSDLATAGYLTADQFTTITDQLTTLQGLQIDEVMARFVGQAEKLVDTEAERAAKAAETQATQVGLMRQLQQMDDDVLGTTVVRDALRAEELATLDPISQGLKKIIWARQDEAKVVAKNAADLAVATAKAAELLKQRTSLEDQLLTAMGRTSEVMARQRGATLSGLDPSLRGLQSALDAVTDANARVAAAETGVADARSALTEAYERESSALKTTIDRFKGFADSLKAFRAQLMTGDLAANSPALQYSRTKADFERVAGLAAQGNEQALGDLQGVSEAYLKASGDYQRTNVGYLRDLSAVKIATKAAEGYASQQVDVSTAQLAALDASVSGLMTVNASVLSVRDAIAGMSAALSELAAANAGKSQADAAAQAALQASKVAGVTIGANDNADLSAAKAIYLSTQGGISSDLFNKYVGANPFSTFKRVGYDGDPEALRKKYNFATGGSFTVGGIGSGDTQNFGDVNLSPGEVVNVSREDSMAEMAAVMRGMAAEMRQLRTQIANLGSDTAKTAKASEKTAKILTSVTRDGEKLLTEAA